VSRFNRLARIGAATMFLAFVVPLAGLAWGALRDPGAAAGVVLSSTALRPFGRSLAVGLTAASMAALLGTTTAWLISRSDLPGLRLIAVLVNLPLVIPSFVGAFALRFAFGQGGLIAFVPRLDGFVGAALALTLFSFPYVTLPVLARLSVAPPAIEESARLLGSGPVAIFRDAIWPQIRPAVWSGSMLVFLYSLSDFGAVSIMRYDTVTRVIFSSRLSSPATALTLGLLLAVTAIVAESLTRKKTASFEKSSADAVVIYPLAGWRWPATAAMWLVIGIGLLAPLLAFSVWWVRGALATGDGLSGMVESVARLASPLFNTALAGSVSALVAVVLLLALGRESGAGSRLGKLGSRAAAATFALPGILAALAVVFVVVRAPAPIFAFYQTFPLLVAVYVVNFGAYAVRTTADAVASMPPMYPEVASTLGAGPARRFFTIELPLLGPAITAGGGLVLLSVLKELPATLLLAPIGFDTLATRIWNATGEGFLADAGLASLALVALSGALTWSLVLRNPTVRTVGAGSRRPS